MKLAIMQPYFFPYIGYFQLISAVDTFVIYDDVQYIKGGWINNNRILFQDCSLRIIIPVKKDSFKKDIAERFYVEDVLRFKKRILRQIEHSYTKAPFFDEVFQIISELILLEERNVSKYNTSLLTGICRFLNISTKLLISSEINKPDDLLGEGKVISINRILDSDVYINSAGGRDLYSRNNFLSAGIELKFLIPDDIYYKQFCNHFIPDLSIIDVLMFNSNETVNDLLKKYHLE